MQDVLEAIAQPGRRAMLRVVLDREVPAGELAVLAGPTQGLRSMPERNCQRTTLAAL